VSLKIPAGIDTGARMRLRGEGEGGRKGGPPGDLYVIMHVEPHEFFQRDGNEIHCLFPLTMVQAAMGTTVEVPTINGTKPLAIPPGTQPGETFTLKGEGVPSLRGGGPGNMIVTIKVVIPEKLSQRQKEILAEFDVLQKEKGDTQEDEGFFKKILHKFTDENP
jgi:molecular chaperone DnaJ